MTDVDINRRMLGEPSGPLHLAEIMLPWLDALEVIARQPGGRWPVLRRGERDDIPYLTRKLVLRRDNDRCKICSGPTLLQLDHVIPWSYGGSDRSDNLRTLCQWCNGERSNYLEVGLPRLIGVTAVCDPCIHSHDNKMAVLHDRSGLWFECPRCRVWDSFQFGDDHVPAYCGTCDATSWVSDPARIL